METQGSGPAVDSGFGKQQEQIKAGWSLLSTLHCVLLSEKVKALGSPSYKKLQVELLAVKWQDRCLQVEYSIPLFLSRIQLSLRCGWQHKSCWWQSSKILALRCYSNKIFTIGCSANDKLLNEWRAQETIFRVIDWGFPNDIFFKFFVQLNHWCGIVSRAHKKISAL